MYDLEISTFIFEQFTRLHSLICFFTENNQFLHDELAYSLPQNVILLFIKVNDVHYINYLKYTNNIPA